MTIDPNLIAKMEEDVNNIESEYFDTLDPLEIMIACEDLLLDYDMKPFWNRKDGQLYE